MPMKKSTRIFLISILIIIYCSFHFVLLSACSFNEGIRESTKETATKYRVTLVYNNGQNDDVFEVEQGKTFQMPRDPQKKNYIFTGWYTDYTLWYKYDFSTPITHNTVLFAGYELNATQITNTISTTHMKALVKVYNKSYNTFLGITTSSSTGQGSGFVYYQSGKTGYYYILTNCHVAVQDKNYSKQTFTIEDYQGNTYEAYLYNSAIDAEYDLACLRFKPNTNTNIGKLDLGDRYADINDDIISLGAPSGQSNFLTYGIAKEYVKATVKAEKYQSNVKFDILRHNAYISGGSSGGPVLNSELKVVGINYAGNEKENSSCAIPISRVREFLVKYKVNFSGV